MATSRLSRALSDGAIDLPDAGEILVLGPPADYDLSALDPVRLRLQQGVRPDHDAWRARGYSVSVDPVPACAAIVCLARSRGASLARIAAAVEAVPAGAPVIVDGQKDEGVDGILKQVRGRFAVSQPFSKAHGKVFQIDAAPPPDAWRARAQVTAEGYQTAPGVFSADGVDPGSAALADALTISLTGRVADLGAGWGYLSARALAGDGITRLDLIEADHAAVVAARVNVTDARAQVIWADATTFAPDAPYDAVLCNPPFHEIRRADPSLGRRFISAAAAMLTPRGVLWLVANRHLPYEAALTDGFRDVTELPGPPAFKLYRAARPRRRR